MRRFLPFYIFVAAVIIGALLAAGRAVAVPIEYQPNYDAGYGAGYKFGYDAGFAEGQQRGAAAGTTAGEEQGYQVGWDATYQPAYDLAYTLQYDVGSDEGAYSGANDGFLAGYDWAEEQVRAAVLDGVNVSFGVSGIMISSSVSGSTMDDAGAMLWMLGGDWSTNGAGGGTSGTSGAMLSVSLAGFFPVDWAARYYDEGFGEGREIGEPEGSAKGYEIAYAGAYQIAYDAAYLDGTASGTAAGAGEGGDAGYSDGWTLGYDATYQFGFDAGVEYFLTGNVTLPDATAFAAQDATVPEPASVMLAAAGLALTGSHRRRKAVLRPSIEVGADFLGTLSVA